MVCRNCKFAVWDRTEKGHVRRKEAGRCVFQVEPLPPLPIAVTRTGRSHWPPISGGIWWSDNTECPTFRESS